ncbi:MAG: galactose mutarotase [Planctomycetota bacterium]|nr:galactose mutarotase [Planctomycetota bacterium]
MDAKVYGTLPDGRQAMLFTLVNRHGLRATLTDFGAILVSLTAPDREGRLADVTLGYDGLAGWVSDTCYMGATAGRYANRIAKGRFALDGKTYKLATNDGPNHLHGGAKGFNKVLWSGQGVQVDGAEGVAFRYVSPDGEEGYPGELVVNVTYTLTDANELTVEYSATTDSPTVVNLTHHSYWNLRGGGLGSTLGHELTLHADGYTPVDATLIPTGQVQPVAGTAMDFTRPAPIGARIADVPGGYDHNWVLRGSGGALAPAARVVEPVTGRVMDVLTTEPGIQCYAGNFLDGSVKGKGGIFYGKHAGFCLETQHFPDSPNRPAFPTTVLRPGQAYWQKTVHRFSVK